MADAQSTVNTIGERIADAWCHNDIALVSVDWT